MTRKIALAVVLYGAALLALTWSRPFWLDEIMQLTFTAGLDLRSLVAAVVIEPGNVPLGFIVQHVAIALLGPTMLAARAPSEIFSALGLLVMLKLTKDLKIGDWRIVALLWVLLPVQLRYAEEARPYAQALFFAALTTWLFFRLLRRPSVANALWYGLSVSAGLYSQPYSILLQAGCAAALLYEWRDRNARRALALSVIALAMAGALFVPWYIYASGHWKAYVQHNSEGLDVMRKLPWLMLRELSGGGYVCSLALLLPAFLGYRSTRIEEHVKRTLLFGFIGAALLAVALDAAFGYFFAIRQILFVVVPLVALAAEGARVARERWGAAGQAALLAIFVVSAMAKNIAYFTDHSEDWAALAARLETESRDGCVLFGPEDSPTLYAFFQPQLWGRACPPTPQARKAVTLETKYSKSGESRVTAETLAKAGYIRKKTWRSGSMAVQTYERE